MDTAAKGYRLDLERQKHSVLPHAEWQKTVNCLLLRCPFTVAH